MRPPARRVGRLRANFLPGVGGLGQYDVALAPVIGTFARHMIYVPYFFWGPWLRKRDSQGQSAGTPYLAIASAELLTENICYNTASFKLRCSRW